VAEQGKAEELSQLLSSGVVNSLKVVDSSGCHALNLALQAGQKATAEVRGQVPMWGQCRASMAILWVYAILKLSRGRKI
jgi:hypothetical protein